MNHNLAPAIQLRQVVKRFKTAAGEYYGLRGVDVDIYPGQFVAIVGKSGSGKSTMLNMITGIDHPSSGEVLVNGVNIYKMTESQRSLWRGKNLGIVFQFFQLLPMLTLHENAMLPMDYCNTFAPNERPERAMELLKMVGLQDQANKLPASVSSGQQQAAAIARALATDPPIIVADEPTGNLDSRSAEEIIDLFDLLVEQGKTIVLVTHDPTITKRTTRTLIIADGRIIDETVAQALPLLTHAQMLDVSSQLEHMDVPAGSTIIHTGQHMDYFFLIDQGEVEVVLQQPNSDEVTLARLGAGDFFGEVELLNGVNSIASVRASPESPVRLGALHLKDFTQMLNGSPLTEESLTRIVQARLAEHHLADRRKPRWGS
jgi:ABC-type lipoprotein export system ATPase subunit